MQTKPDWVQDCLTSLLFLTRTPNGTQVYGHPRTQGIQPAATATSDRWLAQQFSLDSSKLSACVFSAHTLETMNVFLSFHLKAIVFELLIFNSDTVIFNISHHTAPIAHLSVSSTARLALSATFLIDSKFKLAVENEADSSHLVF